MIKSVRQSLKGVIAAGATLLLVPGAQALPVFDGWVVDNGTFDETTIKTTCANNGFTCEIVSVGDGFIQVQWSGSNETYIQTIIADQGATSATGVQGADGVDYSDESFIQLGNVNGIMSRQHSLQEDVDANNNVIATFDSTSEIRTGWSNLTPDANNPNMAVTQTFNSQGNTGVSGDEFNSSFDVKIIHDSNGAVQDRSMSIDQTAGLGDGVNSSTDAQRYVLEQRKGAFTTDPDTPISPDTAGITLDPSSFDASNNPLNGGSVDWVAGDEVMLRWIGQRVDTGTQGVSVFGFEGVTNVSGTSTTGTDDASTFSTTSTGIVADANDDQGYVSPFDWDTTFGTTPPTLP